MYKISTLTSRDLKTVSAILEATKESPLPILSHIHEPSLGSINVYSDISGHLLANPSLGIYIPRIRFEEPFVASVAFPRYFLDHVCEDAKKVYNKTMMLEGLAFVTALCLDPSRFVNSKALFHIDNVATIYALKKGYSTDPLTTTVIRAARVVDAGIKCRLFAEWERRRS